MKITKISTILAAAITALPLCAAEFITINQPGGATLGYSPESGVQILEVDGLKFKDLNRNGVLDKYEDWRLSAEVRAADLAKQLSKEEIAGLMLYSAHQAIPANEKGLVQAPTVVSHCLRAVQSQAISVMPSANSSSKTT